MTMRHPVPHLVVAGLAIASLAVAGLAAFGGASPANAQMRLAATSTNIDNNALQDGYTQPPGTPPPGLTPGAILPLPGETPRPPETRGNPLWGIPLKSLTATRERPIFLPSRRAPAPVVAGPPVTAAAPPPPPPPSAPDRPRLSLVGAIVGDTEGYAVFLDETTRAVVKLKTGDSHGGWILQSVRGREATLTRDSESIVISLPAPNDRKATPPQQQL